MKKIKIILVLFIVLTLIILGIYITKPKSYTVTYIKNDFIVKETYNKNDKKYYFNIHDEKYSFDFIMNINRIKKKEILTSIEKVQKDEYLCLYLLVGKQESDMICSDGLVYVDSYYAGVKNNQEEKKEYTKNNIDVFDKTKDYYVWTGYGIKDINTNKAYKFLEKESYDNNLSYKTDRYIIFADYDQEREFNVFYIFDYKKKKIKKWKIKYKINDDSYFLGMVDNYLYLFDKKNSVEYKINIEKRKINIVNKKDMGDYFNEIWDKVPLREFTYNNLQFRYNNYYNYLLENNSLYLRYKDSNNKIRVGNKDVEYIIEVVNDTVYYFSNTNVYSYNLKNGENKLLTSFEWNFTNKNKIFIFDK